MDCNNEPIGNNSGSRDVVACIHALQKVEIKDQEINNHSKYFSYINFPFFEYAVSAANPPVSPNLLPP